MSYEEQNSAIYTSIINSYDLPKGLIVNVSANKIHLIHYNRRNILNQAFIPVGPKDLVDMYSFSNMDKAAVFEKITKYIKAHLSDYDWLKNLEPEYALVGNGSFFEDLSKMDRTFTKYPFDILHLKLPAATSDQNHLCGRNSLKTELFHLSFWFC